MSKQNQGNAHHLLFQDYKFPLADRDFLDTIAFIHYDGAARSKRVSETIRETLRNMCAFPGFRAQYALHVTDSDASPHAWRQVIEHATLIGQQALPFAAIQLKNGPLATIHTDRELISIAKLIPAFEACLECSVTQNEWWVEGGEATGNTFQVQTFLYEWRRILLDLPGAFVGTTYKDSHGKVHLYFTQAGELQFEDERIEVSVTLIPPAVFNEAVLEASKLTAAA
jgi:plasmid stabilization system protein ParE